MWDENNKYNIIRLPVIVVARKYEINAQNMQMID